MRRALGVLPLVLFLVMTLVPGASACSCIADVDPRETLEGADGAFIGHAVDVTTPPPSAFSSTADPVYYRFEVDEDMKDNLPDEITVRTASSGASCGFSAPMGETVAMFMDREAGGWASSLCWQIEPDKLRKAAEPLPAPDGEGPPRFVLGVALGKVRTMSLDAEGRVLAYGEGSGRTNALDVCPGGNAFAELAAGVVPDNWRSVSTAVRDVSTLGVRNKHNFRTFEDMPEATAPRATHVACLDPDGDALAVIGFNDDGSPAIVRVEDGVERTLYRGEPSPVEIPGTDAAYVMDGSGIVRVDLTNGAHRRIADVDGIEVLHVSPDERHAFVSMRPADKEPKEHFLLDLTTGRRDPIDRELRGAAWVDDHTFAMLGPGDAVEVYDTSLRRVDGWTGWGGDGDVGEGLLFDSSFDGVRVAPVRSGPARVLWKSEFNATAIVAVLPVRDAREPVPATPPSPPPSPESTEAPLVTPETAVLDTDDEAAPPSSPAASGVPQTAGALIGALALLGVAIALARRRSVGG